MNDIQTRAINLYAKNIDLLQNHDKDLYSRIVALSEYIDNGQYKERYHLEYIEADKEFDIFDTKTETYLYNKKPTQFIKDAIKSTNLDKVNSFDLLHAAIYNYFSDTFPLKNISLEYQTINKMTMDISEYTKVLQKTTLDTNKKFKTLEKFVFVGTLLGQYIPLIHNKIKANTYLICENNLEIFRLSLFITDYSLLTSNATVTFSIMDDEDVFGEKFKKFYTINIKENYMIKYYCSNYNIGKLFDYILSNSSKHSPLSYKYTKMLNGLLKLNMENLPKYPTFKTKNFYNLFENSSILILGAGPSLNKNIEWLKKNKNNYTLIAMGATLKTLIKHNITPDLIISVDPDEVIQFQFSDEVLDKITHIPFLTSSATHQSVLKKINPKNIFLFEVMATFKKSSVSISGFSVGEVALHISAILGANNVYMLGTDLAMDQDTGSTHTDEHALNTNYELSNQMTQDNHFVEDDSFDMQNSTISVKGNFKDKVVTTLIFYKSIMAYHQIVKLIHLFRPDIKIFNLSDGAYIPHTLPLKIGQLEKENNTSKITSTKIQKFLSSHSQAGFTPEDKKYLLECIELVDTFIEKLNEINQYKSKSYEQFIEQREVIFKMITQDFNKFYNLFINKLYYNYILIIEPYLGYHFNDPNKINTITLKKVKKIWIKHMIELSTQYKEIILKMIK